MPISRLLKRVLVLALLLLPLGMTADAQRKKSTGKRATTTKVVKKSAKRTTGDVRSDKNRTERQISETSEKISSTNAKISRQMSRLQALNADIETSHSELRVAKVRIDSLSTAITADTDTLQLLEERLEGMRAAYASAMRSLQPHSGLLGTTAFIFSAKSVAEAWNRVRYIREFSTWRRQRVADIDSAMNRVTQRRSHLSSLRASHDRERRKAEEATVRLQKQKEESSRMVTELRSQEKTLRKQLAEQKKKAQALDRELDRLIAAEQQRIAAEEKRQKAAAASSTQKSSTAKAKSGGATSSKNIAMSTAAPSRALTGSFEQNKGRLLFPVAGQYRIVRRFGRQPHPTLKHVETDNAGIDIEVQRGASARAVFAGTVSYVINQPGFNSIVMVRHGKYISIYAGLEGISVKQGDSVTAGQTLGRIGPDPNDTSRSLLHFELRNERQKLNPLAWVR